MKAILVKKLGKFIGVNFRVLGLLLVALILQSCASSGVKPDLGNTDNKTWFFQAKGKIAMNLQGKNTSANLDWKQEGFKYKISIFSAFGIGATIEGAPFFVEASIPGRSKMQAASLDYLIQRGLDFPLPLSNMVYWIKGEPAPGQYNWQKSETPSLEQDGWKIIYANYKSVKGFEQKLPHKIDMSYGGIKVRIVLKEWIKL